jgi:hypothetical protein
MSNKKTNNDCVKIYEPLKCSNIEISLRFVLKNITNFNLCNIDYSNLNKICNHFDLKKVKEIDELTKIIILLTTTVYSTDQKLDSYEIKNIDNDLFKNTIKIMKKLKIISKDSIFYHLKKPELKNHINVIIALISIRINCKDKYIDTRSLIIIYYSLSCLYLMNRKPKNPSHIKSIIHNNILPDFNANDIKQCCLNYC